MIAEKSIINITKVPRFFSRHFHWLYLDFMDIQSFLGFPKLFSGQLFGSRADFPKLFSGLVLGAA